MHPRLYRIGVVACSTTACGHNGLSTDKVLIKSCRYVRPNISGYFGSVIKGNRDNSTPIATGAFIDQGSIGSKTGGSYSGSEPYWRGTNFQASNSDGVFGSSETIQVPAGYTLMIIKA